MLALNQIRDNISLLKKFLFKLYIAPLHHFSMIQRHDFGPSTALARMDFDRKCI